MLDMSGAESCSLAQVLSCDFPRVLLYPGVWSIMRGGPRLGEGCGSTWGSRPRTSSGAGNACGCRALVRAWPREGRAGLMTPQTGWVGVLGANSKPQQSASHTPTPFGSQDVHCRAGFLGRRSKGASFRVAWDLTSPLCSPPAAKGLRHPGGAWRAVESVSFQLLWSSLDVLVSMLASP